MMKLTYYRSESPLLEILLASQEKIFDRPYAGYLLFLFGKADEEIASWFTKNLLALDSLTGSSLAGLVFAERVRINVQRVMTRKDSYKQVPPLMSGSNVDVSQIRYERPWPHSRVLRLAENESISSPQIRSINRLVNGELDAIYESEREISAITYGSDKIAREINVQEHLPCIVLLNATPTSDVEFICLRDQDPNQVLYLLRQLVASFTNRTEYDRYFDLMARIHAVASAREERTESRRVLQGILLEEQGDFKRRELWSVRLRRALAKARYKEYNSILRKIPFIDRDLKGRLKAILALRGQGIDLEKKLEEILPVHEELVRHYDALCKEHLAVADEKLLLFDQSTDELSEQLV